MRLLAQALLISSLLITLTGCQSAYYSAMESVGQHKRDIMLDRVENAQDAQKDAQEQFTSALEQLSQLIAYDGGDLAEQYQATKDQYDASKEASEEVASRIAAIEDVAEALFDEWQDEVEQYSSAKLRRQSEAKLKSTQRQYKTLIKSMHRAHDKMAPVLAALKDNTLYLKHNLNARAIGALEGEYGAIKKDVELLIKEMNSAIKQSQQFLDLLQEP